MHPLLHPAGCIVPCIIVHRISHTAADSAAGFVYSFLLRLYEGVFSSLKTGNNERKCVTLWPEELSILHTAQF